MRSYRGAMNRHARQTRSRGRQDAALEVLAEGEPLLGSVSPAERAQYRLEQARALAASGQSDRAGKLAMEVAGLVADLQPVLAGRAYLVIAPIFEQLDERERALELCELAIERAEQQPPNKVLVDAYKQLSSLLKAEGRRDEALALLGRALTVQERFTHAPKT